MRFGLIGTNFISDTFVEACRLLDEIKIQAVCSGKYENALVFQAKYNIPHAFETYEQMLDSGLLDAVYVASPNGLHFEMVMACIDRKLPVFCEKPFMVNDVQTAMVLKKAVENKTYVHDGIVPLYTENFQIIKAQLAKIGKIRQCNLTFSKYSSRYDKYLRGENPTTFRRELANGSMMDLGVYVISDALALFGKPQTIYATAALLETGVDGCGSVVLGYDGFNVTCHFSKVNDSSLACEICGEKGMIEFDGASLINQVKLKMRNEAEQIVSKPTENAFVFQLRDFVENVKNQRSQSSLVSHELTLLVSQVLTQCRQQCGIIYPQDEQSRSV